MSDIIYNSRRTTDQWQVLVEQQIQSGLSGAAFCKAEGIKYQTFMSWRSKLSHANEPTQSISEPQFVELPGSKEQPVTDEPT